jgi:DNA polymerase-1
VPPEELKEVAALVEEEMAQALKLSVPLKVDLAAGPNWLEVAPL